uniref:Sulfhydryl oxidase n=1 Tax=Panagrellus redivivus TaxID=6233 RepID=A0A7E4UU39_PANRE
MMAMGKKFTKTKASAEATSKSTEQPPRPPSPAAKVAEEQRRRDCPVDKDELGRSTWNLLHTMAAYYPEKPTETEKETMKTTLDSISKTYPCTHCAEDFRKDLKTNPPAVSDRDALAKWMCELHNRVNVKIGKDVFDCGLVKERWLDGWKDGSCD